MKAPNGPGAEVGCLPGASFLLDLTDDWAIVGVQDILDLVFRLQEHMLRRVRGRRIFICASVVRVERSKLEWLLCYYSSLS